MLEASVDSSHSARISGEAALESCWKAELLLAGSDHRIPASLPPLVLKPRLRQVTSVLYCKVTVLPVSRTLCLKRRLCRSRSYVLEPNIWGLKQLTALTVLKSPQISPRCYILFSSFIKDFGRLAFYFEIKNRMCASFLNNLAMKMPETPHFCINKLIKQYKY